MCYISNQKRTPIFDLITMLGLTYKWILIAMLMQEDGVLTIAQLQGIQKGSRDEVAGGGRSKQPMKRPPSEDIASHFQLAITSHQNLFFPTMLYLSTLSYPFIRLCSIYPILTIIILHPSVHPETSLVPRKMQGKKKKINKNSH